MTLAYAGCRLSEALALTLERVDLAVGVLGIERLKKTAPRPLPRRAGAPCPAQRSRHGAWRA